MHPSIYHVSTFYPTICGIATYTQDLINSVDDFNPLRARLLFDIEDLTSDFDCNIIINKKEAYLEAANKINHSGVSIVSLQHEFGIYGGEFGEYVIDFINAINLPIISTLHTVNDGFSVKQKRILEQLINRSDKIIVLTEISKEFLIKKFNLLESKIAIIRHGVHEVPFINPKESILRAQFNSKVIFVSAGHLRPTKGYEFSLFALAKYKKINSDFKFIIIGTYQEQFDAGQSYKNYLEKLIIDLDLISNIIWIDKFVSLELLLDYFKASDIGLVTYTNHDHNSSGIMPIMLSCGRPVIATKFEFSLTLNHLIDNGVFLADVNDSDSIFNAILKITESDEYLNDLRLHCYSNTRDWLWAKAGSQYSKYYKELMY